MPSLRARLVNRYIRSTFRKIPLPDVDPVELRNAVEARVLPFLPKGVAREEVDTPVKGEWLRPADAQAGRTILYLHGGGYVFGSPRTHRPVTYALALDAAAPVFSLDYRMAPEHACPAAIEDALAAWRYLRDSGVPAGDIYIGGDSAGGGLTLALMQALKEKGETMPGGAFLFSPWADLASQGASIVENADSDSMFTADTIKRGASRYAGDLPLNDPRVSPLYGAFDGLPRMIIFASTDELLRDDSIRVAEKAKAAGVEVDLRIEEGLVHVWPLFKPLMPESARTLKSVATFIRKG
ncbi:MAG: alpha/beta hydrolase [Parvularculaceae bacterium]